MTVAELMRETVVTAARDTPAVEVARSMREDNIGSVVIVDDGAPVGIVTDRDLAVRIVAEGLEAEAATAGDVMTPDPETVDVGAGIFDLCTRMYEQEVRRMPVVEDGDLVGIATLDDVLVLLTGELGSVTGVIEAESPPY